MTDNTDATADSGSNSDEMAMTDNTDATMEMIRAHVEKVGDKDPYIYIELRQLEEDLSTGMSLRDLCTHCHADKINQRT